MSWSLTDYDEITINLDNGFVDLYIPKFRIQRPFPTEGDILYLYWNTTESDSNHGKHLLALDYTEVTIGYGGPTPSSVAELESVLEGYIISAFSGGTIPDLEAVLTAGNDGGGIEITNIADGTASSSAATVGQLIPDQVALAIQQSGTNYADGITYYYGNMPQTPVTATYNRFAIYIPYDGTLTMCSALMSSFSVAGSNESISLYIRLNDTTDYLVASVALSQADRLFENLSLNSGSGISVSQGDWIVMKVVCPTWATNPTSTYWGGNIILEKA